MPPGNDVFQQEVESFISTTSMEILGFPVFRSGFQPVSDHPHELRETLKSIAKASSRLHNINTEYKKLGFQTKRQFILSEEALESARGGGMLDLAPEARRGLSKEERVTLVERSLPPEVIAEYKFWRNLTGLIEDAIRLAEGRLKELSSAQKNVLGQLEALRQEIRMQGYQVGGPKSFSGQ